MYRVQNAAYPLIGAVFFIVLIIFGSFFALNLLLAVLANSFEESKGQEIKEVEEEVRTHSPQTIHTDRESTSRTLSLTTGGSL